MSSVNKAILVGNLGSDPEVRDMPSGKQVCNFNIATSEVWRDKNSGEKQTKTEWHRIVLFDKIAEVAGTYLKKGSTVYIEGRLQTRKWTDKDGIERYTTEVVGDKMQMLGKPNNDSGGNYTSSSANKGNSGNQEVQSINELEDDIPF